MCAGNRQRGHERGREESVSIKPPTGRGSRPGASGLRPRTARNAAPHIKNLGVTLFFQLMSCRQSQRVVGVGPGNASSVAQGGHEVGRHL